MCVCVCVRDTVSRTLGIHDRKNDPKCVTEGKAKRLWDRVRV